MTSLWWHALFPFVLAFAGAPLLLGIIVKTKAFFTGRVGAPLLQPYYDIVKNLSKTSIYSTTTSPIFKLGIVTVLAATCGLLVLLPVGKCGSLISFEGDIILFVMLLAIARFALVLVALDTGSAFEGLGASRELFFSALAEPIILLSLVALCKSGHIFSLSAVCGIHAPHPGGVSLLIGAALFVIVLVENSRIPIDDPTTHLELTMIHEVLILDCSGPDLGLLEYAASIKLWIFSVIVAQVLTPFHAASFLGDLAITLGGMVAVAVTIGIVESSMARLRLTAIPQLLLGAGALAIIALLLVNGAFA